MMNHAKKLRKVIHILTRFKKKMPQWAKKDKFLFSHFYTCLAHPKFQQCFITTKILKMKFVAQQLAKQKKKT